jgi:hypothetical protein
VSGATLGQFHDRRPVCGEHTLKFAIREAPRTYPTAPSSAAATERSERSTVGSSEMLGRLRPLCIRSSAEIASPTVVG